jgi:Bacterial Ig-like domain (group 3)
VAGTFAYTPAKGTVLGAGTQTLSVTFTPSNTANYTGASASVTLQVNPATPKITWPKPAAITYGTALSSTQLDATSPVAGNFVYSPAAGTILDAGTQTLSLTFTPTNTIDYKTATHTVTITVNKAASTTTITSNTPNPSLVGQTVNIAFGVTGIGAPTGTVKVTTSTGQSCIGTLSGGTGSCVLTFTASGSPKLTAAYSGDSNFKTSSSPTVTQTVEK